MGNQEYGIDSQRLKDYATEIKKVVDLGCEVAIVIGGGNIFRGVSGAAAGMDRVQGDYMGMLATVINGMALQELWKIRGLKHVFSLLLKWIRLQSPSLKEEL